MIYQNYSIGGELYHHGILGQKWGKQNGPPYPLDESDHSEAEKRAARSVKIKKLKAANAKLKTKKAKYEIKAEQLKRTDLDEKGKRKQEKLENKINKMEMKSLKNNTKIDTKVYKYLKDYGRQNIIDLDDARTKKAEVKLDKILVKLEKEKWQTRRYSNGVR